MAPSSLSRAGLAAGVLAALVTWCAPLSAASVPPRYDHVVIVVEENRSVTQIIGDMVNAPYINSLASNGVRIGSMYAITHPSQPNYMHLFSGTNQGVLDDNLPPNFSTTPTSTYPFTTPNLGAEIIAAGFTFAGFSDELESAGATDWADYDPHTATNPGIYYRRKHVPWVNWVAKVLPVPANQMTNTINRAFTQFPANFAQLPTLSIVVPNQLHDMHDGSRKQGDDWLAANLNAYAVWARTNNSLLVITWDEDDYNGVNQIATVFHGAGLRNGTSASGTWTLHNLLRTFEDMYGSTNHAGSAAQVRSIVGPFSADPVVSVATFRQGLNGYASARDTQLWQETPDASYATLTDLTADLDTGAAVGNQEGQVLLRFDNLFGSGANQVPTNATLYSAKLICNTPTNSTGTSYDSPDTFRAHRMILDWTDTATWNSVGGGVAADNVESASAVTFSTVPNVDGAPAIIDVTSDLDLFKAGTPNRGWVIRPASTGTGNGWTFKSSEYATDPTLRPSLEIVYSVPTPPTPVTLLAAGTVWRYLDNGVDQGSAWRSNSFNDAAWKNGAARLGFGGDGEITTINRTNANGSTNITFYFRRAFYVPDPSLVQSLQARLIRDDGAVIYLNGGEVWRDSMPAGLVTFQTLAAATIGGAGETTFLVNSLNTTALVAGWNMLAAEIHQVTNTSSDVSFDFELTGTAQFPILPALSLTRSNSVATFKWPADASYFSLRCATNLILPVTWLAVTNVPVLTNGHWTVSLPAPPTGQRFYRLQTP